MARLPPPPALPHVALFRYIVASIGMGLPPNGQGAGLGGYQKELILPMNAYRSASELTSTLYLANSSRTL